MPLRRCHEFKMPGESFTKILKKSAHHGWTAKKNFISRTFKTPFLSFCKYVISVKNKLRKEKHKQPMVNSLQQNTALQVIYTRGKKLHYPNLNLRPAIAILKVIQLLRSHRLGRAVEFIKCITNANVRKRGEGGQGDSFQCESPYIVYFD